MMTLRGSTLLLTGGKSMNRYLTRICSFTALAALLVFIGLFISCGGDDDDRDESPPYDPVTDCQKLCSTLYDCDPTLVEDNWQGYGGCNSDCEDVNDTGLECMFACTPEDNQCSDTFRQCILDC
jgi:hypothetical protein